MLIYEINYNKNPYSENNDYIKLVEFFILHINVIRHIFDINEEIRVSPNVYSLCQLFVLLNCDDKFIIF